MRVHRSWDNRRWITATVHPAGATTLVGTQIAFAWAEPRECRLVKDPIDGELALWIDSAMFVVSAEEADRIAAKFAALGLHDQRTTARHQSQRVENQS